MAVGEVEVGHSGLEEAASGQLGDQTLACQGEGPSVYSHGYTPL